MNPKNCSGSLKGLFLTLSLLFSPAIFAEDDVMETFIQQIDTQRVNETSPVVVPQAEVVDSIETPQTETQFIEDDVSPSVNTPVLMVVEEETPTNTIIVPNEEDEEDLIGDLVVQLDDDVQLSDLAEYILLQQNQPLVNRPTDMPKRTHISGGQSGYLPLNSSAALVVDAQNGKVLYQKNSDSVMSIASITKLMSAMVLLDSKPNMNQIISIQDADVDRLKGSSSRLPVGTRLSREEMLHLGLMSSENRAIHALARNYSGGLNAFMRAMNAKAQALGMKDTVFYDPTGLDPRNRSTAEDLVKMVQAAHKYDKIRHYSTHNNGSVWVKATIKKTVNVKRGRKIKKVTQNVTQSRQVNYRNTNKLIRNGDWDISLQKTGYIREAGRCMVVYARINKRPVIMVLMNSASSSQRTDDAYTMRSWLQTM